MENQLIEAAEAAAGALENCAETAPSLKSIVRFLKQEIQKAKKTERFILRVAWFEQLGRAVAEEAAFAGTPLQEGAPIEHQTGTVWVPSTDGQVIAISTMKTEELGD